MTRAKTKGLLIAVGAAAALGLGVIGGAQDARADSITITLENGIFDPNPPVGAEHGPHDWFEQDLAIYGGLWHVDPGTPAGFTKIPHTHILYDDLASSRVDTPHSWRNDLQGGLIRMLDGSQFSVVSIDYRLTRRVPWDGFDPNSQFALLPWSFAFDDVQLLLSTSVNPATADFASYEAQWTPYAIDDGSQHVRSDGTLDPWRAAADSPWRTLNLSGYDDITSLFLGHTGSEVQIDNIVIEFGGAAVPEPGTGVLVSLGLVMLAARRRGRRDCA